VRQILLEARTLKFQFLHTAFAKTFSTYHEYKNKGNMKRMDFKNVNLLNSRVNMLSGNLLPIASDNSRFSVIWRTHSAAVWLIELIHTIAGSKGRHRRCRGHCGGIFYAYASLFTQQVDGGNGQKDE